MNCKLDLDSPSYPPQREEYLQCACGWCLEQLGAMQVVEGVSTTRTEADCNPHNNDADDDCA